MLNFWQTQTKDANIKELFEDWLQIFQDKDARYGYIDSHLDSFLGMQIRVLREQRKWTQTELGDKCNMKQTRISLLESMNYSDWSLDVLRRLAKAFNLRLVVKFEDFGSFFKEYLEDFDRENLKRRSFEDDVLFSDIVRVENESLIVETSTNRTSRKVKKTARTGTEQLTLPFSNELHDKNNFSELENIEVVYDDFSNNHQKQKSLPKTSDYYLGDYFKTPEEYVN